MFRKSVSFFVLVALLWVLLWLYIPDGSPDNFTIGDFFRGFFLLFSLMAFAFALLILTIRYKGVDIATNFIPHAGMVMWLAKHAYEFSQPKTILHLTYQGLEQSTLLTITTDQLTHNENLLKNSHKAVNLGYLECNPKLTWGINNQTRNVQVLSIEHQLKKLGRNLEINVLIDDQQAHFKI